MDFIEHDHPPIVDTSTAKNGYNDNGYRQNDEPPCPGGWRSILPMFLCRPSELKWTGAVIDSRASVCTCVQKLVMAPSTIIVHGEDTTE